MQIKVGNYVRAKTPIWTMIGKVTYPNGHFPNEYCDSRDLIIHFDKWTSVSRVEDTRIMKFGTLKEVLSKDDVIIKQHKGFVFYYQIHDNKTSGLFVRDWSGKEINIEDFDFTNCKIITTEQLALMGTEIIET
jgi:hypothetical protein